MQTVASADGTMIAYEQGGHGPHRVLVHGVLQNYARWALVRSRLEKHFTVNAMDRRGRGDNGDSPEYSNEHESEDIAAVANTLHALVPAEPGAYLLIMETSDPMPLEIRTLATAALPAGRYAYAGSACGRGGIRARVIRHLKANKKRHWHIDHLTAVAPPIEVTAFPGRTECDILAEILARPGASIPVPGFGSSDCRNCPAHLVQLV